MKDIADSWFFITLVPFLYTELYSLYASLVYSFIGSSQPCKVSKKPITLPFLWEGQGSDCLRCFLGFTQLVSNRVVIQIQGLGLEMTCSKAMSGFQVSFQ